MPYCSSLFEDTDQKETLKHLHMRHKMYATSAGGKYKGDTPAFHTMGSGHSTSGAQLLSQVRRAQLALNSQVALPMHKKHGRRQQKSLVSPVQQK